MRNIGRFTLTLLLVAAAGILAWYTIRTKQSVNLLAPEPNEPRMRLTSPAFQEGESIPARYTCDGVNVNPPLEIIDAPASAKSLALIVDDPDAPRGDWVHWIVWNIPPSTTAIGERSVPVGATEGVTDFGRPGYGGPCPPSGTHRYFFKLYALDTRLQLVPEARKADLEKVIAGHAIAQATLIGRYARR